MHKFKFVLFIKFMVHTHFEKKKNEVQHPNFIHLPRIFRNQNFNVLKNYYIYSHIFHFFCHLFSTKRIEDVKNTRVSFFKCLFILILLIGKLTTSKEIIVFKVIYNILMNN